MKYQDFSLYEKIISSSRAVKIPFLPFTCADGGVAMVTNMISQLQESFPLRRAAGTFENFISIYKINRILHGRAGIRILSSRAERISHERAKRRVDKQYFFPCMDKIVVYSMLHGWREAPLDLQRKRTRTHHLSHHIPVNKKPQHFDTVHSF